MSLHGHESENDTILKYCQHCDEEYIVPEEQEQCPICRKELEEL